MLATDELIKKATTLVSNVQKLIPQIWAAQIETNLRKTAVLQESVVVNSDLLYPGSGDTVYVPILPDIAPAALLTEGTDMTPIALSNATSVPLTPVEYGTVVEITRKALDRIKYDGMAAIMDRLSYAMTLRIEGNIALLYNATVPSVGGSLTAIYPNGHATGTIVAGDTFSDALLLAGLENLRTANNVPFDDGYFRCYITPHQFTALISDANIRQDLRYAAPKALLNNEVGALHGCRIVVTNYPVIANEGAGAAVPVHNAFLLAPRWAAIAYKRKPEAYIDPTLYDGGRRKRFGVTADFDAELLHAERAVILKSA